MNKIFIAPISGEQTTTKFSKTKNGGYNVSDLKHLLSPDDYNELNSTSEVFFWGNKPNSKSKWNKIEIHDFILFYEKRTIVSFSRIVYKSHNPKLAEEIWGFTKTEKGDDVLWEYLFFYEKPVPIKIPFIELIEFADYSKNYVIQGFTPYSMKGIEKIKQKYGNIGNFLNSSSKKSKDSILAVNFRSSGLILNGFLVNRFISSLLTKPFVILTGLSGSGKTKLAQAFAMWMSGSKEQYAIVPVGADWTNREPLLGYPNSLKAEHYVKPDSGVLDILLSAHRNFIENDGDLSLCKPFFLILDEMNLSHVERYFADFLSAMESGDEIKLYSGTERYDNLDEKGAPILGEDPIPNAIVLPKNLFIIGTVNIDETTYMFSPKVLDRANTIEFRISKDEMAKFLDKHEPLDMEQLLEDVSNQIGKGASQTSTFMTLATRKNLKIESNLHLDIFVSFFKELQFAGAEFGYRTANEMSVLVGYLTYFGLSENDAYDIAIMQKMLPKLHGSRSKLGRILPALIDLCENKYPISFEKLTRMKKSAEENGFASYAEA